MVRTHLRPPGKTPDFITARLTVGVDTGQSYNSGMPNTKAAGDITEAIVLAEFLRAGFSVCVPFGDNRRYDLVVEAGGPGDQLEHPAPKGPPHRSVPRHELLALIEVQGVPVAPDVAAGARRAVERMLEIG